MALTIKGRRISLAWLKPPPSPPDGSMTLFEHLRELRYRLIVAAIFIIAGTVVAWFFQHQLIELIRAPFDVAKAAILAKNPKADISLVNNNITEPLSLAMKVSGLAGLLATAPVWLYQLWAFIVPGLLAKEKRWALIFIGAATPMFLGGVAVAYLVMPKGIAVLLSFTQADVSNLLNINVYLSFLMRTMIVFGIAFLIPLIVVVLNLAGVIKARQLAKARSVVIFLCFVFGAVATPSTDPFSMLALAVPMTLLFLAAEVIAHVVDRRRDRRVGSDLAVAGLANDRALRELSDGDGAAPA